MARATGRTFLTATTDDAPALEGYRGHGVFTYALLDAFSQADVNGNGLIEISELADHIDRKVPDLSFEAFKLRQIPQRSIVGNNFALLNKAIVLAATPASPAPPQPEVPTKPTHVVIASAEVRAEIESTIVINRLAPGSQVTVMESKAGWKLIARDGKAIGYVEEKALLALQ